MEAKGLPPSKAAAIRRLENARRECQQPSPVLECLCEDITRALEAYPCYSHPAHQLAFDAVLWELITFVDSRLNTMVGYDESVAYLFKEPAAAIKKRKRSGSGKQSTTSQDNSAGTKGSGPVGAAAPEYFERALQVDFTTWLKRAQLAAVPEAINMGSGRSDIAVMLKGVVVHTEVKREDGNTDFASLCAAYGQQATEYSNSNLRLAILLVLDMTRQDGTGGGLASKFAVRSVMKANDTEVCGLVIAVVPGRRKRPSSL